MPCSLMTTSRSRPAAIDRLRAEQDAAGPGEAGRFAAARLRCESSSMSARSWMRRSLVAVSAERGPPTRRRPPTAGQRESPTSSSTRTTRLTGTLGDEGIREGRGAKTSRSPLRRLLHCHWCHVRSARASPTPNREADQRRVRPGQVDREERPDSTAYSWPTCSPPTAAVGGRWTVFLTPGRQPFYAAPIPTGGP